MSYEWYLTEHARQRWIEKSGRPIDQLIPCLDESKNLSEKLRKVLIDESESNRHKRLLKKNSGFFFRVRGNMIFVLDNLRVVTVYKLPDSYIARQKAAQAAYKASKLSTAESK
jgi:hypothetical protein